MATVEEALAALEKLLDESETLKNESRSTLFEEKFERWSKRAEATLRERRFFDVAERFQNAHVTLRTRFSRQNHLYDQLQLRRRVLAVLRDDLATHPDFYTKKTEPAPSKPSQPQPDLVAKTQKVFLGHGRSMLWHKVERWLEKDKGILVEGWESEPHAGEQVIQVLAHLLSSCTFAVLVVTGEDATLTGSLRARQNVVHEIGLFQGRLGFEKVAVLEQEGTESFSNVDGLQTIRFVGERIEAAFVELERMMRREGLIH